MYALFENGEIRSLVDLELLGHYFFVDGVRYVMLKQNENEKES